jgi:hypothetical protein
VAVETTTRVRSDSVDLRLALDLLIGLAAHLGDLLALHVSAPLVGTASSTTLPDVATINCLYGTLTFFSVVVTVLILPPMSSTQVGEARVTSAAVGVSPVSSYETSTFVVFEQPDANSIAEPSNRATGSTDFTGCLLAVEARGYA